MQSHYPWINASPTEFHDVPRRTTTKVLWFIWFRSHAWQPGMWQCCEHGPRLRSEHIAQVIRVQYQSGTTDLWGFLVQSSSPSLEIVQFHHSTSDYLMKWCKMIHKATRAKMVDSKMDWKTKILYQKHDPFDIPQAWAAAQSLPAWRPADLSKSRGTFRCQG